MSAPTELFQTKTYLLPGLDIRLMLVHTPDVRLPKDMWFVVTPLCEALGIVAARQRQRIKVDTHHFVGAWDELPVKYVDVGYRNSLCVRMEKIGAFFNEINPNKVLSKFAGRLVEIQRAAERAAAKAVLGEDAQFILPVDEKAPTTAEPVLVSVDLIRAEIHIKCVHGTPHCIILSPEGNHIVVGEEV